MAGSGRDQYNQVAESTPFDNDANGFVSDDVQAAIEEVNDTAAQSASPGFTWGKGGSAGPGEYINNDEVESNKAGRLVPFDGFVTNFFVNNESTSGTRTLQLMLRRPCQTGTFTPIASISLPPGTPCGQFIVSASVLEDDELAVRVAPGSDDFENPIVGIIIKNSATGTGGSSFIETLDEGISIDSATVSYDFTGVGVTATSDGNGNITVDIPGAAGAGENNTASNIGGGEGVFAQKVGVDLEFKSIQSTGSGTITSDADEVFINFPVLDTNIGLVSQGLDTTGGQSVVGGLDISYATIDNASAVTIVGTTATFNVAGSYEIHFDYTASGGTGSRSESEVRFQEDTGGGFVNVPGTLRKVYHRTTAQGDGSASCVIRRTYAIGDQLKVNATRVSGAAPITTVADGCVMTIKYLRSSN